MSSIILFEEKTVRRAWDAENQKWLFAIVDVLGILTESTNPAVYWRVLKMTSAEGKQRLTDVADSTLISSFSLFPSYFLHHLFLRLAAGKDKTQILQFDSQGQNEEKSAALLRDRCKSLRKSFFIIPHGNWLFSARASLHSRSTAIL